MRGEIDEKVGMVGSGMGKGLRMGKFVDKMVGEDLGE